MIYASVLFLIFELHKQFLLQVMAIKRQSKQNKLIGFKAALLMMKMKKY